MSRRRPALTSSGSFVVVDFFLVVRVLVIAADLFFFLLVIEVVFFVGDVEFERRIGGDAREGAAFRAGQLGTDIDIVFIDVDRRIALGTNRGHAGSSLGGNGERSSKL